MQTAVRVHPTPFELTPDLSEGLVHIIDDDRSFAGAIALQLESIGLHATTYLSGEHFLSTYSPAAIECAIVDLRLPGMHGLALQSILRKRRSSVPLIVISAFGKTPDVVSAIRNGATDFLEKPVDEEILFRSVSAALMKDKHRKDHAGDRERGLRQLTDREREVLELLLDAKTTKQIASLLAISPKTVEKHRAHVYEKLAVDSVPALIKLLLQNDP